MINYAALSVINLLNSVHKDNVDSGKAVLRSELEAQIAAEQSSGQVQPSPVNKKAKVILEPVAQDEEE